MCSNVKRGFANLAGLLLSNLCSPSINNCTGVKPGVRKTNRDSRAGLLIPGADHISRSLYGCDSFASLFPESAPLDGNCIRAVRLSLTAPFRVIFD